MVFLIFIIAIILLIKYIAKFSLFIIVGDVISGSLLKFMNKPYKRKHYNFCGANRIALTKVDKYCSKKYQKKFNKMS